MSVVTGVMLIASYEEALAEVQAWLEEKCEVQLVDVADHAGGGKHPQFEAWSAGINHFDAEDEFVRFVLTRKWECPENVVLILKPEQDATRTFRPFPYGIDIPPPIVEWLPIATYEGAYGVLLYGAGQTIYGAGTVDGWAILAENAEFPMDLAWQPTHWALVSPPSVPPQGSVTGITVADTKAP